MLTRYENKQTTALPWQQIDVFDANGIYFASLSGPMDDERAAELAEKTYSQLRPGETMKVNGVLFTPRKRKDAPNGGDN